MAQSHKRPVAPARACCLVAQSHKLPVAPARRCCFVAQSHKASSERLPVGIERLVGAAPANRDGESATKSRIRILAVTADTEEELP